ncbi:hypothetical protein [Plantibacter sp. CFBP 13570]|uniref:hypothetical protein n=1 Tax=Plantibacter sp. CFBP 13570 TaxID=2775272 RepID=UPI001930BC26|nr:hypothetical protein [Plantibacter sp. CFBP 13570]MBD8533851.1 hypothetical protein [Plantibacter sp. CFBP 13570]
MAVSGTDEDRIRPSHGSPWLERVVSIVAWAALVAFTLLTIGLPLVGVGTFLGTDLLTGFAPWSSSLASTHPIINGLVGDTIDTVTPQTWAIAEAARSGELAAWNPYVAGGAELGGLPNSGIYSPLSVAWWFVPLAYAPGISKLIEIAVVALGMALFLGRLRVPHPAWPVASIIFLSSGFMIAWTNWSQTQVAALIPLLFWTFDRVATRRSFFDAVPLALVAASMILGGFPAVTAYGFMFGALYVVVRVLVLRQRFLDIVRVAVTGVLGLLGGFALSAFVLLPFVINASSVIDFSVRRQSSEMRLSLLDLLSSVIPSVLAAAEAGPEPVDSAIERFSYIGVAAVVLGLLAIVLRARCRHSAGPFWFIVTALVGCIVVIYIGGPLLEALQTLPVFSNNPIARLRVIAGFLAAVLAAFGVTALLRIGGISEPEPEARPSGLVANLTWPGVGIAFGAAVVLLVVNGVDSALRSIAAPELRALADQVKAEAVSAIWIACIVLAVAVLVVAVPWQLAKTVAICAVPLLVVGPAIVVADGWWPKSPSNTVYPVTPAIAFLQEHVGEDRFATAEQTMLPGTATMYGVRSVGGHAYHTREWKQLLEQVEPDGFISATYSSLRNGTLDESIESPILDRLGVRYVIVDPNLGVPGTVESASEGPGTIPFGSQTPVRSASRVGPVRSVFFRFASGVQDAPDGSRLVVRLVDDATGAQLARTATWYPHLEGLRSVAVVGEGIPESTSWHAELTLSHGTGLIPQDAASPDVIALSVVRPVADTLRVVHTGDATILERQSAFARVRWANSAVVESSPTRRVSMMDDPDLSSDTVLLEHRADMAPNEDSSATISPSTQQPDGEQRFAVTSDGAGWVVIEDSLRRPGWSATIDGTAVPLLEAEHAGAAIRVPGGIHEVVISYEVPGRSLGLLISLVAAAAILIASLWQWRRRRGRRIRATRTSGRSSSCASRPRDSPSCDELPAAP